MTVLDTITAVFAAPPPTEAERTREQIAKIDEEREQLDKIEREIQAAVQKKATAQATADDMGAAVAQMALERLAKQRDQNRIGELSAHRNILIDKFVAGGPQAERLVELNHFLEMFDVTFGNRGRDFKARRASKVAGEVKAALAQERHEIQQKRLAELGLDE